MSEKALKIVSVPEIKAETAEAPPVEAKGRSRAHGDHKTSAKSQRFERKRLRMILLIVLPLIALIGGAAFYLLGGRYITTDNAYVGAQKVLITPDVSGKIVHIAVHEGEHVKPGDELFTLDPEPYRLALEASQAKLAAARTEYDKLKTTLTSLTTLTYLEEKKVALKKSDYLRKSQLVKSQAGSRADLDSAASDMVKAQLEAQTTEQQRQTTLSQLLGNPNLPLAQFPAYAQAKAAVDDAQRNLRLTVVRAPILGTATQVDSIELGRYIAAGTPVFSVIDDQAPWVDANPKETAITYLRVGQPAMLEVDSFPGRVFKGHVVSVSPGTGAQFSILPPQNATGNWIKVVQRVPVRIAFNKGQDLSRLRAGMSVNVSIDTGHSRLPSLFTAATKTKK